MATQFRPKPPGMFWPRSSNAAIADTCAFLAPVKLWQHCALLPVLHWLTEGAPPLRTGVAEAAVLLAAEMATIKETMGL